MRRKNKNEHCTQQGRPSSWFLGAVNYFFCLAVVGTGYSAAVVVVNRRVLVGTAAVVVVEEELNMQVRHHHTHTAPMSVRPSIAYIHTGSSQVCIAGLAHPMDTLLCHMDMPTAVWGGRGRDHHIHTAPMSVRRSIAYIHTGSSQVCIADSAHPTDTLLCHMDMPTAAWEGRTHPFCKARNHCRHSKTRTRTRCHRVGIGDRYHLDTFWGVLEDIVPG
jgi:hypothetical protein